eukprot:1187545-Prorocentrum_minimum.AAC.5
MVHLLPEGRPRDIVRVVSVPVRASLAGRASGGAVAGIRRRLLEDAKCSVKAAVVANGVLSGRGRGGGVGLVLVRRTSGCVVTTGIIAVVRFLVLFRCTSGRVVTTGVIGVTVGAGACEFAVERPHEGHPRVAQAAPQAGAVLEGRLGGGPLGSGEGGADAGFHETHLTSQGRGSFINGARAVDRPSME